MAKEKSISLSEEKSILIYSPFSDLQMLFVDVKLTIKISTKYQRILTNLQFLRISFYLLKCQQKCNTTCAKRYKNSCQFKPPLTNRISYCPWEMQKYAPEQYHQPQ